MLSERAMSCLVVLSPGAPVSRAVLYTVSIIININMVSILKEPRIQFRRQRRRHAHEAENAEIPDITIL